MVVLIQLSEGVATEGQVYFHRFCLQSGLDLDPLPHLGGPFP